MEEENSIIEEKEERKGIELTDNALKHLLSVRRWTFFFSVVGSVFVALFFLGMIIVGTSVNFMPQTLPYYGKTLFIIYAIVALLFFIPLLGLYRFSVRIKEGIDARDSLVVEAAFKSLKVSVQAMGVLLALVVCLYVLVSLVSAIALLFA